MKRFKKKGFDDAARWAAGRAGGRRVPKYMVRDRKKLKTAVNSIETKYPGVKAGYEKYKKAVAAKKAKEAEVRQTTPPAGAKPAKKATAAAAPAVGQGVKPGEELAGNNPSVDPGPRTNYPSTPAAGAGRGRRTRAAAAGPEPKTRGQARRAARNAGEKVFTWKGKKYGTRGGSGGTGKGGRETNKEWADALARAKAGRPARRYAPRTAEPAAAAPAAAAPGAGGGAPPAKPAAAPELGYGSDPFSAPKAVVEPAGKMEYEAGPAPPKKAAAAAGPVPGPARKRDEKSKKRRGHVK
jgi:hypothetical protein